MKNILKVMFSVMLAFIVFTCISAFTDSKVTTESTIIAKNNTTVFALPTVNPVSIMLDKPVVESVSIDTVKLKEIIITSRIDKKSLDKLLRFIKKDPKFYCNSHKDIIITMVTETLPELVPLKPIEGRVVLSLPLPPLLVLKV